MKLSLAEPKFLKESVFIISELVNEARFKITPSAIELIAMDPANVAMVIFKLLSSSFVEYKVEKEQELSINLANLKQILRRAGQNDMVTLEIVEGNKLQITLKSRSVRKFMLPIIELDDREQKIPDLNFPVEVTMESGILNSAIEDVDVVGEAVSLVASADRIIVSSEGDLNKAQIEIEKSDEVKIQYRPPEDMEGDSVRAKYSIEYLKKMIAGAKLASDVTLLFSKDYPLKIEYKAVDKVFLSFILAPRVEND